jgi:HAD superfamily hydrolase (TIGR01509 family)
MSRISAVCFDAFGTLIRNSGRRVNPYRRLVQPEQSLLPERLPFLTRNIGIAAFAEELNLGYLLPVLQRELDEEIAGLVPFPDVELMLRKLRASGKRVAVCSNLAAEYGESVRRLLPDLDAYVLSYEVGVAKPDPRIYEAVCSALGSRPGDVLFIGDSKRCDVDGPLSFGMQARWLDRNAGQTLLDSLVGVLR